MTRKRISRFWGASLILLLAGTFLAGCKTAGSAVPQTGGINPNTPYTSKVFTTSYANALDASSQLMLGVLKLEGTDNAITADQAKVVLNLLQALRGGQAFKAEVERNAVLASVEAQLTPAQSSTIANMRLAKADLETWMKDNSQAMGPMPGGAAPSSTLGSTTRGQGAPGGTMGQGGVRPQGTPGARPQGSPGAPGSGGTATGQNDVLLGALIRLLMTKTGGSVLPAPPAQ